LLPLGADVDGTGADVDGTGAEVDGAGVDVVGVRTTDGEWLLLQPATTTATTATATAAREPRVPRVSRSWSLMTPPAFLACVTRAPAAAGRRRRSGARSSSAFRYGL
jgi:hypothetical protein